MTHFLTNRTALVTGSTRGLGRLLAQTLAGWGAAVAVHGRAPSAAGDELVCEIAASGGRAIFCPGDLRDATAAARIASSVAEALGPIDILINCASRFILDPVDQVTPAEWGDVLQTTLTGTFHMTHAALPQMRGRGWGRIINFGCVGCDHVFGGVGAVPYRIAASGNLSLTRAYARQLFSDGITVNLIAPGHMENTVSPPPLVQLPAGRLSQLAEILPTVRFLLSDESAHMSGAILNVAGGYGVA